MTENHINNTVCNNCEGQNWCCEEHPNIPWLIKDGSKSHCGAPGIPCDECNFSPDRDTIPRDLPDFTVLYDETGDKRN